MRREHGRRQPVLPPAPEAGPVWGAAGAARVPDARPGAPCVLPGLPAALLPPPVSTSPVNTSVSLPSAGRAALPVVFTGTEAAVQPEELRARTLVPGDPPLQPTAPSPRAYQP